MKIVFRVDASVQIGTGHAMRCLTLAETLCNQGAVCHFICRKHTGNLLDWIRDRGFSATALPTGTPDFEPSATPADLLPVHAAWLGCDWRSDAEETREVLRSMQPDWLIVDHYALDSLWERALHDSYRRLMVIDDLADRMHKADIVVDQTLGRRPGDYSKLAPEAVVLAGSRYALLRPEFAEQRVSALARRTQQTAPRHLLINLGGMDGANHTPRIVAMAGEYWTGPITVVMGANAPGLADVRRAVERRPDTTLEIGSNDMAGLLCKADLAIGAAGSSAWERCALGLPTLLLTCVPNQRQVAKSLCRAGAAIDLGDVLTLQPADVQRGFSAIADPDVYRSICLNAANVCDGYGALRVSMALAAPQFENGSADDNRLLLRAATHQDVMYLFYLQTRPGVRKWFLDPRLPQWDKHRRWCRQQLASPNHGLYLIYNAIDVVGMVRLDRRKDGSIEISLLIDPVYAGRGFATQTIQLATDLCRAQPVVAHIHPENAASQRAFAKAGFHCKKKCQGFQHWQITR